MTLTTENTDFTTDKVHRHESFCPDEHFEDDSWCFNPESHCERCSIPGHTCVHHGADGICDRDPEYVVNVIAAHFSSQQTGYVGIVWEAIANGVLKALGWHRGERVTIDEMGRITHD